MDKKGAELKWPQLSFNRFISKRVLAKVQVVIEKGVFATGTDSTIIVRNNMISYLK
jgi:hypothetical protein